ncbi:IS5 family transposase [Bradyrhizobium sp. USDA 241]
MSVLLADKGYDGDKLRGEIIRRGAKPVIPNKSNRVVIHRFNKRAYKESWPRLFGQRPAGFKWIPAGLC